MWYRAQQLRVPISASTGARGAMGGAGAADTVAGAALAAVVGAAHPAVASSSDSAA